MDPSRAPVDGQNIDRGASWGSLSMTWQQSWQPQPPSTAMSEVLQGMKLALSQSGPKKNVFPFEYLPEELRDRILSMLAPNMELSLRISLDRIPTGTPQDFLTDIVNGTLVILNNGKEWRDWLRLLLVSRDFSARVRDNFRLEVARKHIKLVMDMRLTDVVRGTTGRYHPMPMPLGTKYVRPSAWWLMRYLRLEVKAPYTVKVDIPPTLAVNTPLNSQNYHTKLLSVVIEQVHDLSNHTEGWYDHPLPRRSIIASATWESLSATPAPAIEMICDEAFEKVLRKMHEFAPLAIMFTKFYLGWLHYLFANRLCMIDGVMDFHHTLDQCIREGHHKRWAQDIVSRYGHLAIRGVQQVGHVEDEEIGEEAAGVKEAEDGAADKAKNAKALEQSTQDQHADMFHLLRNLEELDDMEEDDTGEESWDEEEGDVDEMAEDAVATADCT